MGVVMWAGVATVPGLNFCPSPSLHCSILFIVGITGAHRGAEHFASKGNSYLFCCITHVMRFILEQKML